MSNTLQLIRSKKTPIEKHLFLANLQMHNVDAFYSVLLEATDELLPLVYTPHVGAVCQSFSSLFPQSHAQGRGLFLSIHDRGQLRRHLRAVKRDVAAIVVTDGQRILGLGDLGANGMGIPIGKLALYSALAGVPPNKCLPVTLDVGCNVESIRNDPTYLGNRHPRVTGDEYFSFLEEFLTAAHEEFDGPLIQFEDFGNHNAFQLLRSYENRLCCFNDDIQGTAAVVLAGLLAATRITGQALGKGKVLLFGAGEAAIGIAQLLVAEMKSNGVEERQAKSLIYMIDSKGLVVKSRSGLSVNKREWAQDHAQTKDLEEIIRSVRPSALIGVGAVPRVFTPAVIKLMASLNRHPIIFALSNPTDKSECTAEEAYLHSEGRAIFASGSPFAPCKVLGKKFIPGQCNNSYIFPGVGLGVTFARATRVTEAHFIMAAHAVADAVTEERLERGCLFPPLASIRDVSLEIATRVAQNLIKTNVHRLTVVPEPKKLKGAIAGFRYTPNAAKL